VRAFAGSPHALFNATKMIQRCHPWPSTTILNKPQPAHPCAVVRPYQSDALVCLRQSVLTQLSHGEPHVRRFPRAVNKKTPSLTTTQGHKFRFLFRSLAPSFACPALAWYRSGVRRLAACGSNSLLTQLSHGEPHVRRFPRAVNKKPPVLRLRVFI
jgi:hypothetical protein